MVDYLTVVEFFRIERCSAKERGREVRRRAARLICVVVVAAFLMRQSTSAGSVREVRRVLIINDLGIISSPGFAEIIQAILTGLQKSPYRIELYEESLDLTLFPDRLSQDSFREEIIHKYSARKPDVIIAAGPVSLKFIAKLYDKFQGTPTIFCTVWTGIPDEVRHGMPFTGVVAQLHPEGTLNAALHLLPSTKHVVVVGGVGKFDEGFEAIAKQSFHNYESKLEFTYLFDLTMPALLERLKHLPNDTIVYHTAMSQDAAGDRFIDSAQSIPMVASAANAPVFVMDDVDLRAGTVGGDLVNWADDAGIAAAMAVRVLNGEKPQDIPIVKSPHVYMFDWHALKRWGLKERNLPPGSIVLNRQTTVWESYKWYIISGISLIFLEALLIGGLVWQRAGRLKSEKAVRASEERLRLAQEIARIGSFEWNIQKGVSIWTPELEALYGLQPGGFPHTQAAFENLVHADDRAGVIKLVDCQFKTGQPTEGEWRVVWPDGSIHWIAGRSQILMNESRQPLRMIGVNMDVTERKRAEEALLEVNRRLIEAQEQERARIGRELHDDVTQRLAMLALELEQLEDNPSEVRNRVQELRKQTTEISNDVQALSHELHASKVEYLGAVRGMKSWCEEFSERQGIQIEFKNPEAKISLPQEIGLCLFRVLQEALHNADKHSGVKRIEVQLREDSGEIHLVVSDLGRGFDWETAMQGRGLGLTSMQERVRLVNGTIEIQSKPMGGTTVHVRVPFVSEKFSERAVG